MRKIISIISIIVLILFCLVLTSFNANALSITYTPLDVPTYINSSWKTWMPYTALSKTSPQRKYIETYGWTDSNGFLRCNAERDLGVTDDYYIVAMGTYYAKYVGMKFRITTNTGNIFYAAIGDFKANIHTNSTNQYGLNKKDIVEMIVNRPYLNSLVKQMGTANVYMPLNGSITKIERIDFVN